MRRGFAPILVIIIVAIAVIGAIAYSQFKTKPQIQPSTSPFPIDEKANWKTYENKKYGYSIKYPPRMIISPPYKSLSSAEDSATIDISAADSKKLLMTINSRSFGDKTRLADALNDVFLPESIKEGKNILIDDHAAFYTSSVVLIQQNDYDFIILNSYNSGKNEQDQQLFDQIISTFKFIPTWTNINPPDPICPLGRCPK